MNPELFLQHFDKHVHHIHDITGAPHDEIRQDLRYTKSLNDTLERFYQGKWLDGVPKPNAGQPKLKLKRKEVIILDLDDSDDEAAGPLPAESGGGNSPKRRKKSITPPRDFLAVMESDPIFFTSPVVPEQREVPKAKPRTEEHQMKLKPKPTAVVNLLSSDDEEVMDLSTSTRPANAPAASSVPSFSTASRSTTTASSVPSFTTASRTTTTTSVSSTSTSTTAPRKSFSNKPKTTARPRSKDPEDPMQEYSASTRAIMAMFDSSDSSSDADSKPRKKTAPRKKTPKEAESKNSKRQSIPVFDAISPSPPPQPQPKKRTRLTSEERTARSAATSQKAAEKTTKASEKAALKATKDAAKASAAAEKAAAQLLNSVNKLRNSKTESLPELHVCLSPALASYVPQLAALLTTRGSPIDTATFHPPASLGRLLVWDRNRTASYSPETGLFTPLSTAQRCREPHLLAHLTAREYVSLVGTAGLDTFITDLHRLHPPCTQPRHLILLLEGYQIHLRSLRNADNRRFQSRVRGTDAPPTTTATGSTEATLEQSLLTLQLRHNLLIHHTSCVQESVEWIALLTGDVAQVPYRRAKAWLYRDVAFCAEGRAGTGARDTFVKMLQEVSRVTPQVAEAVVREAGSVEGLVGMLACEGSVAEVEMARVGVAKKLGVALERRLRGVFYGRDEGSMVGS